MQYGPISTPSPSWARSSTVAVGWMMGIHNSRSRPIEFTVPDHRPHPAPFTVIHAGRTTYPDAVTLQQTHHAAVLASRDTDQPEAGRIILTEHLPVITVTRRPGVADHVLLPATALAARGVAVHETDRGGDVTYHGPGQLVCYPIVDLNALGLRIHEYMRALEEAVIRTLAAFGIDTMRDPGATGVWVTGPDATPHAKICAMGVRVRRWVAMHGLAINIDPDMAHFALIVPCGLPGRPVTCMREHLGDACPPMDRVAEVLVDQLGAVLTAHA
jgi:lipoyl(octanoyl) transferase